MFHVKQIENRKRKLKINIEILKTKMKIKKGKQFMFSLFFLISQVPLVLLYILLIKNHFR